MVDGDLNGGELVAPLTSIVTEDQRTCAVLDVIGGVSVGGDTDVGDDVAVVVERGHSGRAGASVRVNAESENRVTCKQHTRAYLADTATTNVRYAQLPVAKFG